MTNIMERLYLDGKDGVTTLSELGGGAEGSMMEGSEGESQSDIESETDDLMPIRDGEGEEQLRRRFDRIQIQLQRARKQVAYVHGCLYIPIDACLMVHVLACKHMPTGCSTKRTKRTAFTCTPTLSRLTAWRKLLAIN